VWKSSPLALLFHGLSGVSENQERRAMEIGEMEKRAREIKVRLQDAQLVACGCSSRISLAYRYRYLWSH
jgi:hypothetical protein